MFGYEADLSKRLSIGSITAVKGGADQVQVELQQPTLGLGGGCVAPSKPQNNSASVEDAAEQYSNAGKHEGDHSSDNELEKHKRPRTDSSEDSRTSIHS